MGQFTNIAGELAYRAEDWATARDRFQQALAAGYTENDLQGLIAETYFKANDNQGGLDYLQGVIDEQIASAGKPEENYLKRGLAVAYNADMYDRATAFSAMQARYYPSSTSWADAINIQRNFKDYEAQELLDLLRLSRRVDALTIEQDYVRYIDAADYRRLLQEVRDVAQEGLDSGVLVQGDTYVAEVISGANGRIQSDKSELPSLERDARAGGAKLTTVAAAGDAFLSYGEAAKAEEFYKKALTMPGVDTHRVRTRLGIAQLDQGRYDDAAATFAQVEGNRTAIANLWALYAQAQAGG